MTDRALPWPGLILALTGAIAVAGVTESFWLPAAIFLLWAGSLFIARESTGSGKPTAKPGDLSRADMRQAMEHSGIPLIMLDESKIIMANAAAREIVGGHILGQDARVALRHPGAVELLQSKAGGCTTIKGLGSPRSIWRMQLTWIDERYAMIELLNRTAEADISRAHTDFVANASHELRTPLASIIGYVETLSEDPDSIDPETRSKFLGTILKEAKRLQNLVSDLMSLSRVEAEKHDSPREKVKLDEIVSRASAEAGTPEQRERVALEIGQGPFVIDGETRQLEQMVRNLVDNALKYGAPDTPVNVRLETHDQDRAILSITDKGEGIPSEHIPHLTRRFYRTDPGRSRAAGGTGLGLAIVKHIVERHRGRLDIQSLQGQGTTVTVKVPLAS